MDEPTPQPAAAEPPGQQKKATKWVQVSVAIWITDAGAYRTITAINQPNEIWIYEETPTKVIGWRQLPQDIPPST